MRSKIKKSRDYRFSFKSKLGCDISASLQCYSVLSTIAQVLRKMSFSILIFDALFITDL